MNLDNKLYYSGNHDFRNDFRYINVSCGARGTGKTFFFLYWALKTGKPFIWLRHTERVVNNLVSSGTFGQDVIEKTDIPSFTLERNGDFTYVVDECSGLQKGYLSALSTFHNFRGANFEHIEYLFFDEFIPEEGTILRKGYGTTFLNTYETINRNREFEGKPPLKVFLFANSEYAFNEIFPALGIHHRLEDMIFNKKEKYFDDDLFIELYKNDAFREKKKDTLLYRIANNNKFVNMALNNDFTIDKSRIRKSVDRRGSFPLCMVNNMTIVKLSNNTIYCMDVIYNDDTIEKFDTSDKKQLQLFRNYFHTNLLPYYLLKNFFFDSIFTHKAFLDIL